MNRAADISIVSVRHRRVTVFCLAVAAWAGLYFAGQLLRGWVS